MQNKIISTSNSIRLQTKVIFPVVVLLIMGLMILKSTSSQVPFFDSTLYKQIIWIGLGIFAFFLIQYIRVQVFYEYAYILYGFMILALVMTYAMPAISGSHRWLFLGPIRFQPSELGKMILIFTLAKFLSDRRDQSHPVHTILLAFCLSAIPALIVFKQPDLGTAIIYIAITVPMLFWAGVHPYYLFLLLSPFISILAAFNLIAFYLWIGLVILILIYNQPKLWVGVVTVLVNIASGTLSTFIWNHLYPHQKQRILTFLDPMMDPRGAGYQIIQSITAIGSGGFLGKGLGQGTQTHLRFLPVRDTDFIISVLSEELGFIGIIVVLIAFFGLVYWVVTYARFVHNHFSSLTLVGIISMLFVHMSINMGMTVGWLPVTGLPAPFISYGGSFLLTSIAAVAMANNIISNDI
ncbi:MAG: rod shape-determining protein RodA [FCB group bacterium]|nr:rod shape-determining protein RodA [FCB group bacterium]